MKNLQESQATPEIQSTTQASHESQTEQQHDTTETPVADSGSVSVSSNDNKKVSLQDIDFVQNLIERCIKLYMNKDEVVKTLLTRAKIDPGFTTLVWQKLEEGNPDFFRAYYVSLKLKKQIILFNHLLEHQYHLTKYPPPRIPLAPMHNGIHQMHVNNLPMGYPVLQQPPMQVTGQHHMDTIGCGISSYNVVNGVPAPVNFHPMQMNSGNDMGMDSIGADMAPIIQLDNATSAASNVHFPFRASEITGLGIEFTSDVANGLQLGPDGAPEGSRDSFRSLDQITWNFSLSDLTADLSNLGDFDALGHYPPSPFLPSNSDILLDSPERDNIEEFFAESGPDPPSEENK